MMNETSDGQTWFAPENQEKVADTIAAAKSPKPRKARKATRGPAGPPGPPGPAAPDRTDEVLARIDAAVSNFSKMGSASPTDGDKLVGIISLLRVLTDRQASITQRIEYIFKQLQDVDNDIQDLLELAKRQPGKQPQMPLQSIGDIAGIVGTTQPSAMAQRASQPSPQPVLQPAAQPKPTTPPPPFGEPLGLRTVSTPQRAPVASVPVPPVPAATMKLEYTGDIGAMADALVFQDNQL